METAVQPHASLALGSPSTSNARLGGDIRPVRTVFIDNLKVFLTLLVVLHHAGQPYGPTGGAWPVFHAEKFRLLGPFFHINASFFMGLFFLISGYYLRQAYQRKGARAFLADRVRRLGVPILVFSLGFMPLAKHWVGHKPWAECFLPLEWAHLWFLGHLLVYAFAYAAYRHWQDRHAAAHTAVSAALPAPPFPAQSLLLGYALCLAIASAIVRIWFPIDLWVHWGVPAEVAHLPQYVSLFVFGVFAARYGWLERIPAQTGRNFLALAVAMVVLRYAVSLLHAHFLSGDEAWVDFAWCLWEALLCVGMCVGLLWLFHARLGNAGAPARFLARHAFAVYVIHLPILVFIQMAMEHTTWGPLALALFTGAAAVVLCYGLAAGYARLVAPRIRAGI